MKITLHHADWADAITDLILEARKSVTITGLSYLFPGRTAYGAWRALHSAISLAPVRGVRVVVMLPEPSKSHPATANNARTAREFEKYQVRTILVPPTKLLHAKTVLIDHSLACVGSGNWTQAAACHNLECWTVTDEPGVVASLRQIHDMIARRAQPQEEPKK